MEHITFLSKRNAGITRVLVTSIFLITQIFSSLCYSRESIKNLAPLAAVIGSGKNLSAAVDGIKHEDGTGEWIGGSPNAWYGWIDYPKLELRWEQRLWPADDRIR